MAGCYCERCDRMFPHGQAWLQHVTHSGNHDYCLRCDRDFVTPPALAQHKNSSSKHNLCVICPSDFPDVNQLEDHYEEDHWQCSSCRFVCNSEDQLEQHYAQSDAHHYCASCKREFSSASNLSSHLRSTLHAGLKVRCIGCSRLFPSVSAMTIHLEAGTCASGITRQKVNDAIRAKDTQHLITQKLLTYPDANGSQGCIDTWATEAAWNGQTYSCYFCPKDFRYLQALNQHLKSPAHEQKLYHCPKCGSQFRLFSGLVQHVESESCGIQRFAEVKRTMDHFTGALSLTY